MARGMFDIRVKKDKELGKVAAALHRGAVASVREGAKLVRRKARQKITRSPAASAPGEPPHTRKGKMKKAMIYSVDQQAEGAYVGYSYAHFLRIGRTHEFGGVEYKVYKGRKPGKMRLWVGGYGPIAVKGGKFRFAKLRTQAQVDAALKIAPQASQAQAQPGRVQKNVYPARPTLAPTLRENQGELARLWENSVK